MNSKAFLNTLTNSSRTLPLAILYVTEGCNLRCITCSYREALPDELSLDEIRGLAKELHAFGLRHIVYSGGEPLFRRDFKEICETFAHCDIKQTLLTNGLLLDKRLDEIHRYMEEIILSIDGPTAEVHNRIRGIDSFDVIVRGVKRALSSEQRATVSIRTVVQKENFRHLNDMVAFAKSLGVDRLSFLAADVLSEGFGRDVRGSVAEKSAICLSEPETQEFRQIVEQVSKSPAYDGIQLDSPDRLFHIVQYFEALLGKAPFPRNFCNAPMVSAVITATGNVHPCYFLPAVGNIRNSALRVLLNSSTMRDIRKDVRGYKLDRCHTCVCTLNKQPISALLDRF